MVCGVQVDVLGLGVRDPVPSTADGGPLQAALQHVRVTGRLYRGAAGAPHWRGEDAGPPCPHTLPGVGRGQRGAALPLPDHGDVALAVHARLRLLALRVSTHILSLIYLGKL